MKISLRTLKAFAFMFSLMKQIRPKRLYTMPFTIILRAIKPFILIVFPTLIIDNLLNRSDLTFIILLIITMCILEIISTFILEIIDERNIVDGACFLFQLTGVVLEKYMEIDMEDIETPEIYEKYSMANSALNNDVDSFISLVETIFIQILELVGASLIIMTLHPLIVFVLIGFTILLSVIQKMRLKNDRKFDEHTVTERRKYSYLYDTVNDFKYGKELRIYNIKDNILKRVDSVNTSIFNKYKKARKKSNANQLLCNIFIFLQQAGIYVYMIYSFSVNAITVGSFLLYLGSIERLKTALSSIGEVVAKINNLGIRIFDIQSFLSIKSKLCNTQKENAGINNCDTYDIRFVNVSFRYPNSEKMVLKNINITIPQGEKLTIVGDNGAGKSTFIKLLLRIYDPTEGDVFLGKTNIRDFSLKEYHEILAAVFQDYKMLSFTIRENILFGTETKTSDEHIFKILHALNMDNKVKNLRKGLDTYLNNDYEESGIQMSGGEIQKLAIARAVCRNASIFIMDEPTSALDAIAEMEIYELSYKMTYNRTCIFVSHRLSTVRLADKIVLFDDGEISEYGTYKELMHSKKHFYEMYQMQAKNYIQTE